ncbi:MAG: helix-turn-helix domain-containing protein [Aristaeellaceae bacterium]
MVECLLLCPDRPRLTALESGVPWSECGVDQVLSAASLDAARELMLARPLPLAVADAWPGLSLCRWAAEAGFHLRVILLVEACSLDLARQAVEAGVFRLLPASARPAEIAAALRAAADSLLREHTEVYEHAQGEMSLWRHALAGARMLDVFLASGANLQDIVHDGVLPGCEPLWLIRVKLTDWAQNGRWPDQLVQLTLINLSRQAFGTRWQVSPAVPMERDTYALILWGAAASPEEACDPFFHLIRQALGCGVSLKWAGPFPLQEAPEKWRQITSGDLPGADAPDAAGRKKAAPPEVQLWADMLMSPQPQRLMNHLHKYIAGRWNGMPPTQEELQQLYVQFLQAVDMAMGDTSLWGEVLMDADKYDKYIHGGRSLEAFFALVLMTVTELIRLRNASEVSLVERVNLYLEEHLEERVQCVDIAAAFLTSPDHLNRQFKQQTGHTLKEHITQHKMANAQRLLRLTHLPISVVAAKVGYENFSHFSTVYRKTRGESPIETRNSSR